MAKKRRVEKSEMEYPRHAFEPLEVCDFIQLRGFAQEWDRLGLTDDDLRELEHVIMAAPRGFPAVQGTGGLRKARFSPPAWRVGKSGALRVGYVYFPEFSIAVLVVAYRKNEMDDISAAGKKIIRNTIQLLRAEFSKGALQ